ncbi:MAG: carboxypeptidase regulatory-like domain-containing protein, partial [Armatimonadetes bacterium]|nr:carboxypeptidase regulatory-like domain-containing protein [Armatimonadota bacterium]
MNHRRLFAAVLLTVLPLAGCAPEPTATAQSDSLAPVPVPQASASPTSKLPAKEAKGTATGRVVGADGKPVAGATVWVTAAYYGLRRYEEVFRATTDANGAYRVVGLPDTRKHRMFPEDNTGMAMFADAVIAGRPPAHIDFRAMTNEEGEPFANALVEVSTGGENRQWAHYMGDHSRKNVDALNRALQPRITTDASGMARFGGLLPGRYVVRVAANAPGQDNNTSSDSFDNRLWFYGSTAGRATAQSTGVPFMPGRENHFTLRLQTVRSRFLVRYRLPNGTFYSGENASLSVPEAFRPEQPGNEGGVSGSGSKTQGEFDFRWGMQSGIRRVSARLR